MNIKSTYRFLSALVLVFALVAFTQSDNKDRAIMNTIMSYITSYHYSPTEVNDAFSEEVVDIYISRIDRFKRMLLASEIDQIEAYSRKVDDEIEDLTFNMFELSKGIMDHAIDRSENIFKDLVEGDELTDFSVEETIETDYKSLSYCEDKNGLKERWRQMLKLQILDDVVLKLEKQEADDYKGETQSLDSIKMKSKLAVKKRFERFFNDQQKRGRMDLLTTYFNSITTMYDPHTGYFKPKDKQDFMMKMANKLEGIGATLVMDDDYIKIVSIVPGGPAHLQGELESDDLIVKVAQHNQEAINVVGWHINDVIDKIRGKKGTKVTLTVRKKNGSEKDIQITRDVIVFDEGYAKSLILEHEDIDKKIGFIHLPSFYFDNGHGDGRSSSKDVKKEIDKLKEQSVDGIILDLRNNTGGSLNDVVDIAGYFIEQGPIVQVKGRFKDPYVMKDHDGGAVEYDGPLVILVNQVSASASEILAAAMQDYKRAVIVGNKTFGKGTVQRFFNMDRASTVPKDVKPIGEVKITIQKFFRVDGGATQLKGVVPDISIPNPYVLLKSGEEENEHAMPWSSIDKAEGIQQDVLVINNMDQLAKNSQSRVANDSVFIKVSEYAKIIKENRDESSFQLNMDQYRLERLEEDKMMKPFKKLYPEIEEITVSNLLVDTSYIQADSSRIKRNESFFKGIKKDHELEEALFIMNDLIESERKIVDKK